MPSIDLVLQAQLSTLETFLPKFSSKDHEFALSLITQAKRRSLSPKQAPWVQKLIDKVAAPTEAPRQKVSIGDLGPVVELFDRARKRLKFPAIVLAGEFEGHLRLKPAGDTARVPGSINVVSEKRGQEPVWLGRILRDGNLEVSPKAKGEPIIDAIVPALKFFAADPATGAKRSAKLTGRCCFCHTGLKDQRSTDVGYGPICATNYGLPWG